MVQNLFFMKASLQHCVKESGNWYGFSGCALSRSRTFPRFYLFTLCYCVYIHDCKWRYCCFCSIFEAPLCQVERERNSLNSKLTEFENLLRNPYIAPPKSAPCPSPFPGLTSNAISTTGEKNVPPAVSSFSQLGASLNIGSTTRHASLLSFKFRSFTSFNFLFCYFFLAFLRLAPRL